MNLLYNWSFRFLYLSVNDYRVIDHVTTYYGSYSLLIDYLITPVQVAVHEIGHVLGLLHNDRHDSIMYPIYVNPANHELYDNFELARDDRRAVQNIYGVCKVSRTSLGYKTTSVSRLRQSRWRRESARIHRIVRKRYANED